MALRNNPKKWHFWVPLSTPQKRYSKVQIFGVGGDSEVANVIRGADFWAITKSEVFTKQKSVIITTIRSNRVWRIVRIWTRIPRQFRKFRTTRNRYPPSFIEPMVRNRIDFTLTACTRNLRRIIR